MAVCGEEVAMGGLEWVEESRVAGTVSSREAWMVRRRATAGVETSGRGGGRGAEHLLQEKEEARRRAARCVAKPAQETECTIPPHWAHSIVPFRPSALPQMTQREDEEDEGGE